MTEKLSLITTTREDLFDISHVLGDALSSVEMDNPKRPVIVSVEGSTDSGKKIFFDGMRRMLLGTGSPVKFNGMFGVDEYWNGEKADQKKIEIDFVDAAWRQCYPHMYHVKSLQKQRPRNAGGEEFMTDFFAERKLGGLTVVQNSDIWIPFDMAVWVEKEKHRQPFRGDVGARLTKDNELTPAFEAALKKSAWARLVEIEVPDGSLAGNAKIQEAVMTLTKAVAQVRQALQDDTEVPSRPYKKDGLCADFEAAMHKNEPQIFWLGSVERWKRWEWSRNG